MATETDLTGLGMAPPLAALLGHQPATLVGIGTTQSGAPTILTKNTSVNATASNSAVILNLNAPIGAPIVVSNPGTIGSSASALVYVPSGHTLFNTNATVNAAYTLGQQSLVIMWQQSPKQWYAK